MKKKEIRKSQREESKHTAPQRREHLTFKGFCSVVRSESDKGKKILAVVAQGEARDSQTVEACHTYCAVALWENNECPCGPKYGHLALNGKGRDCFDSNLQREQPWECVYLHVCMWTCKLDTERSELLSYSVLWAYSLSAQHALTGRTQVETISSHAVLSPVVLIRRNRLSEVLQK